MAEQLSLNLELPESEMLQLWSPDEIYDRLTEATLPRLVENRRVERKGVNVQAKTLAEYLSMWSNTQPHGGLIIVGVENNGKISGFSGTSPQHKNDLESLSALCPDARWESKEVRTKNSKGEEDFVLVFRVMYRHDKLVETSSGDAFIREGDKKVRILEDMKRELRIAKGEVHYELERVSLRYPTDFDMETVKRFATAFSENRRFRHPKSPDEILELAKLGRRSPNGDFSPNLACALMFAKDPRDVVPGARIRIIRYEGDTEKFGNELNAVYSTFIDGNIPTMLPAALAAVSAQLRSFHRLDAAGRLVPTAEYPDEAWIESIVNAVAHRSYNLKNQNIFIKIFDDRFVVESPGGFVPPTTAETVYDAHNPRNPILMEAMMHLEFTFCGFEGTRRMRRAMESASLPAPRFRHITAQAHQVHVVLENNVETRLRSGRRHFYQFVPADLYDSLDNDEKEVAGFLMGGGEISLANAGLLTGQSSDYTERLLLGLVEKSILELTPRRRNAPITYRLRPKR